MLNPKMTAAQHFPLGMTWRCPDCDTYNRLICRRCTVCGTGRR